MMLDLPAATRARYNVDARHQADDLLGAGAARDQARDHGLFQELRPVRALRLDRGGLGDDAASRRAILQARLGRARMRRLAPDPPARRRRQRRARRRAGRALLLQRLHVRRLLEAAGQDQGGVPRRILHGRRHGAPRRGRLHLPRRSQEQHDHFRRRERLSLRSRGAARHAREGEGRRGDRPCRCHMGRAGACGDRSARRRGADRGRNHRMVPQPHRRIQTSALGVASSATTEMPRTATGKIQHRAAALAAGEPPPS